MTRVLSIAGVFLLLAGPATAQQARVAVSPDTGSVGTVFRVVVQIEGAANGVVLPDTLDVQDPLENAARKREVRDTANAAALTVVYSVAAWKPGTHALPPLTASFNTTAGERTVAIRLPSVNVRSVLPADTTGVEPKPAKAVIGPDRVLWPFIVLGVLLAAALALAAWWLYRRRRAGRALLPAVPALSPRERALRELDAANAVRADGKAFYSHVSDALRRYLAALEPSWGVDLTTSELAVRARAAGADFGRIEPLLHDADLVKFARRNVQAGEAEVFWQSAREMVALFEWPPPEAAEVADAQEAA